MKTSRLFLVLCLFLIVQDLWADAGATWSCKGDNIVLKSQRPYLGENSRYAQTLFILSKSQSDASVDTAFFLKVIYDPGLMGQLYINGKNEVGGKFELFLTNIIDESDGTTIKKISPGLLTYFQGPTLKGKDVPVECLFE